MSAERSNPITEPDTSAAMSVVADAATATETATTEATTTAEAGAGADVTKRSAELAVIEALRNVFDPELGMDVVELALIRKVLIGEESSEVKMILTTPFCPYAGAMIAEIQEAAEGVLQHPVKVTLLAERWDPRDAGLAW